MFIFAKIKNLFSYNKEDMKYKESFTVIQLITYIGVGLYILLPFLYPKLFPWITNIKYYFIITISFLFINILINFILKIINKGTYYKYLGYIGVLTYIFIIYITGGVNSSLIFLLFFTPVLSVSFLDEKLTRNIGIISGILLVSIIFWDKSYLNPTLISKHILNVLGYSLLVYFIYKLIKEILLQRYEKEHYKRKFIELNEVDKVKETFITAMSHQLRTPLNGARWAIEAAINDKTKQIPEFLNNGYNKIIESINIIDEIIKSTKFDISDDFLKLNKEKIDLYETIDTIINKLNFLIIEKNIKIKYIKSDVFKIFGDRKMLELSLINIFDNAFRYSPNGEVSILFKKEEDKIKITIKDSGIGIDSADMEYMFQKFFRGKNAIKIDPNESGVGLYATKKIIEMYGGNINISSVLNKGTTVEVSLPLVY